MNEAWRAALPELKKIEFGLLFELRVSGCCSSNAPQGEENATKQTQSNSMKEERKRENEMKTIELERQLINEMKWIEQWSAFNWLNEVAHQRASRGGKQSKPTPALFSRCARWRAGIEFVFQFVFFFSSSFIGAAGVCFLFKEKTKQSTIPSTPPKWMAGVEWSWLIELICLVMLPLCFHQLLVMRASPPLPRAHSIAELTLLHFSSLGQQLSLKRRRKIIEEERLVEWMRAGVTTHNQSSRN